MNSFDVFVIKGEEKTQRSSLIFHGVSSDKTFLHQKLYAFQIDLINTMLFNI